MILLYSDKSTGILKGSLISIINSIIENNVDISGINLDKSNQDKQNQEEKRHGSNNNLNQYILEKAWRLADRNEKGFIVSWYLLMSWVLDIHGYKKDAEKTLEKLSRGNVNSFYDNELDVNNYLIYLLYEQYKDQIKKILQSIYSSVYSGVIWE
ncbi:MAG: hypothetical protein ABJB76_12095 [Candidatus Nitrosocosmicus sp.]